MKKQNAFLALLLLVTCYCLSCKKLLEVQTPKASVEQDNIFKSDELATSVLVGIYRLMADNGYASGTSSSITSVAGLSADEFIAYNDASLVQFYENQLTPESPFLNNNLYNAAYSSIYSSNVLLEGLGRENGLTPSVRIQIEGEAKFIRAFCYFYLVNLFGEVPLHITTDYKQNQNSKKTSTGIIYQSILSDLLSAETLLNDSYIGNERVRPNKSVVQALLARVYLYLKDYVNAEKYASFVINKTTIYNLEPIDNVFLKNSKEAIWQLMPSVGNNTKEGALFILTTAPTQVSLTVDLATNAFELNDKRKTTWVKSFTNTSGTFYYPFKYKQRAATATTEEYSIVFRLAEQYLIRAEARIQNGNVPDGIQDLNMVRSRLVAGVSNNPIPAISITLNKLDALLAVERERRVELFSEWGHRWLDLKRTGRVTQVLMPIKSNWQPTDMLYPIPSNEISRNTNITQNEGY